MKIIAGLGNPGIKYRKTRHNIGFMVVEKLQKEFTCNAFKEDKKMNAMLSECESENGKIILVMPLTYMNKSGEAISRILNYYKIEPADCIVICDDLDTVYGKIRIRKKGSAGTHNGLKSITEHIGGEFPRLRIGIESRGDLSEARTETTDFVLNGFNKKEKEKLPGIIDKSVGSVKLILSEGLDAAMNKYN